MIVITAWGIAGLGCAFLGGATGQYLYETNKTTFARFLAVCTTLGAFPFLLLTNCSPYWITRGWVDPVTAGGGDGAGGKEGAGVAAGGVTFFAIFLALCGGIVAATGPNVRAVLMHVNSSNQVGSWVVEINCGFVRQCQSMSMSMSTETEDALVLKNYIWYGHATPAATCFDF